jgi:uncharacterized lipoprotein NlpE involved in copper resistance
MPESSRMTKKTLALLMLILPLTIIGCGNSDSQQGAVTPKNAAADDTSRLCSAIEATGLAKQCAISSSDSTVHVMIDSNDDEVARNICADVTNRMAQQTAHLSARWMLQVYSPYRSDKPLAACPLHLQSAGY